MKSALGVSMLSLLLFVLPVSLNAAAPVVVGEYVEARTCDVWTGPCFANGEINLRGDNAVMAWVVRQGSWDGVTLDNLAIVAVVDADGTLSTSTEGKVKTVVYIDQTASESQGKALLSMAAALAPRYLKNVVRLEKSKISYRRDNVKASLEVGSLGEVKLETGVLSAHCDSVCGNEEKAYPSLSKLTQVTCAKTLKNSYNGSALGLRWSDPNRRSAMLGHFEL